MTPASKLREAAAQISYWPRTLRLIWEAAPRWTLVWAILLVIQGGLPAALVYITKLAVDSLVAAVRAGGAWPQTRNALILGIIVAGIMLATELFQGAVELVRTAQSELVQDHIKALVHEQSAGVDLAFYDSSEFHDHLDRARNEAATRPLSLLENIGGLLQNGITVIAIAAILIPYSLWLPLILLVSTLPALYVVLVSERRYHKWWQEKTAERRWAQYYDLVLTHPEAAAEMRLLELGGHFQAEYQKIRRGLRDERLTQIRKQNVAKTLASVAALFVAGLAMAWMGSRVLRSTATLGDFALFFQAFNRGQGLVRSLLGNVGQILANSLYLGNLFGFLDLKPQVVDPPKATLAPAHLQEGIRFNKVTFHYPRSEKPALRNFSLFIPAGKTVAIVGPNGAGKTTLLKLLCRFYDPGSGRIELDGIDVRDLTIASLWRTITVLMQFPLRYHATVAQTIAFGDFGAKAGRDKIEAAAKGALADELITGLPKGYDTLLGKWFADGIDLSGGEWQRVALARAYLRESPVILLDEPTSMMDSWAEADWFERFRLLAQGRTAILITHRFTIAMRADIIHVMDAGGIVESGTHRELIARGGQYARSWEAQMEAAPATEEPGNAAPVFQDGLKLELLDA